HERRAEHAPRRGSDLVDRHILAAQMDFQLSPEQREIQTLGRELAEAEIDPHAAAWDRDHYFPVELFGRLAEVGLLGVCVPEEYGGAGADFVSYVLVLEALSRAGAGVGAHGALAPGAW